MFMHMLCHCLAPKYRFAGLNITARVGIGYHSQTNFSSYRPHRRHARRKSSAVIQPADYLINQRVTVQVLGSLQGLCVNGPGLFAHLHYNLQILGPGVRSQDEAASLVRTQWKMKVLLYTHLSNQQNSD